MAGREGFEPSVDRSPQRFSRPSHSTALAPSQRVAQVANLRYSVRDYNLNLHARM